MTKEIECKFLVSGEGWRSDVERSARLQQFYLVAAEDRSIRIRIKDGREARLTLKFGTQARVRDEFEYAIPLAEAEEMRGFAVGRIIEKTRHIVRHKTHLFEVDVFGGALAGLVIAELETAEDVPGDDLPSWLGREVTGEAAYYNASLAVGSRPVEQS
jgi:CYTH domain-containing protein